MKKILLITLFILSLSIPAFATDPVLLFSDITSGPCTGLGDGSGSGVIVTVWGRYLGSSQSTSKIYLKDSNGDSIEGAHVYYWCNADGASGGGPADLYTTLKMQEIAFSIPYTAYQGAGSIYVTVGGVNSNELPFTVRLGEIYWVSSTGSSSNAGTYAAPWAAVSYTASGGACTKAGFTAGDFLYIKDTMTETATNVSVRTKIGTSSLPFSISSYPGALYTVVGVFNNVYPYTAAWWVVSKIKVVSDTTGISPGASWRIIGNEITDSAGANGQSGAISTNGQQGLKNAVESPVLCYGNYIHDFGYSGTSSLHHVFYLSNRGKSTVVGTDSVSYQCRVDHVAADSNKPTTGVNYATYWEQSSMGVAYASTWTSGTSYDDGKIYGFELGWNYLKDNMARNGLHVYDEHQCGDYLGELSIHDNWVENQAGAGINIGSLATYGVDDNCITCDIEVYNNVVVGAGADPFSIYDGISIYGKAFKSAVKVYNNTFYGYQGDAANISVPASPAEWNFAGTVAWVNNIVVDTTGATFASGQDADTHTNNIWYDTASQTAPAWDTSPIETDPKFTTAGSDFSLQATSPAINAGTATLAPERDFLSIPYAPGTPEIGAFGYAAGGESDTTPPTISNFQPSGNLVYAATKVLSLTISENGTCKYDTSDTTYALMANTFDGTGTTSHSKTINVSADTTYTYYARCTDGTNADTESESTTFFVQSAAGTASGNYNANANLGKYENDGQIGKTP